MKQVTFLKQFVPIIINVTNFQWNVVSINQRYIIIKNVKNNNEILLLEVYYT